MVCEVSDRRVRLRNVVFTAGDMIVEGVVRNPDSVRLPAVCGRSLRATSPLEARERDAAVLNAVGAAALSPETGT